MIIFENNLWELLFDPHNIIRYGGLLLILVIIYLETGFFLGFVLPGGDYMLFSAGIFCGTSYLDIPIFWLISLLILVSFLGDLTGYFKGKWLGSKLFTDNKSRFFKQEYLVRGSNFYNRYGLWAFILGRFIPVIRTLVPMLAGASKFVFRKFLFFDAIGGVIWIGSLVSIGYYIGKTFPEVINYSVYILIVFVGIASIPMLKILFSKKT